LCRTYHELSGVPKGNLEASLRAAAQTLTYGPMICVLFIACRMRVEFLSDGKGEPQMWVQNCMYATTFAVLGSTCLVLCLTLLAGRPVAMADASPRVDLESSGFDRYQMTDPSGGQAGKMRFYVLTTLRYLFLFGLYFGIAGVIVGIHTYLPPGKTDATKLPAPAPAVNCTMFLCVMFFTFQLVIAFCDTYTSFTGVLFGSTVEIMTAAANTVEFAPQLAVLFLAARMRALQHDGQPQHWAQSCMYAATAALAVNAILACLVPWLLGGTMRTHPQTKEAVFEVPNPMIRVGLLAVRFLSVVGFYGGAWGVIHSIYTFESPQGAEHTLPVSPTVYCVVNLTCQFFLVYFVLTVMSMVSELSAGGLPLEKSQLFTALESARACLAFAPMLSIMFVTTRMYALLLTDNKGAPQAWVQDGMYMATWSLLISFLACTATGLMLDKVETDEDGNVTTKFSNWYLGVAMVVVRYLSMLLLYGGISTVIVGLFVMTPETANGRGSVPILSDTVNSTPLGSRPPSADTSRLPTKAAFHEMLGH